MRIIFAGTPEFAVPSLRALVARGHEVAGVITREDAPLGRKRVLTPSPVADAAAELGLPVLKANKLDDAALAWARDLQADLGVIVAYGGLVREPLLSEPTHGWINLHFSDLPRWRGAAPVQRALAAGEQTLSVTAFRLVAALDAGDVLSRDTHDFAPGTTAGAALTTLSEFGTGALMAAIDAIAADPAAGEPQVGETSYAHKLTREDGKLDLTTPTSAVLAQWAGMTPEPGAYALHEDAALKLHELRPLAQPADTDDAAGAAVAVAPGTVTLVGGTVVLQLCDGTLELVRVQPAGKPAMAAADWLRGRGGNTVIS
ncbi:methionyl-tRNA formyltransferase [Leucobacter exalbidus]|uniref:Methionyl-tRNA formyltransferase n=1 Tax=Leucobacter exalbidus TaxID=662960 RepID=A0A940T369_9MICO|nr:methionyl-tRNA formyltransferase [Leucobacter exalbidus]MBP1325518.1 methionyl-tRNA formyltransferase [Leucobacter exalbidus]